MKKREPASWPQVARRLRLFFSVALATSLATASSSPAGVSTTSTTLPGICGNGVVEAAEDCDDGDEVSTPGAACNAGCRASACGKPTGVPGAAPTATDAFFTLRSAVGTAQCAACVCDTDDNGAIAAVDALRLLRFAVGQPVEILCGACADLRRRGVLQISDSFPVPEAARAEILEERKHVEAGGLTLSEDGSLVTWPLKGAAGWWIRAGENYTLTDEDGRFEITFPQGERAVATIAHPQQSDTPLFEITAAQLVPADMEPTPQIFERESFGPCGMNGDAMYPDPEQCSDIVPPATEAEDAHAHHHHSPRGQFANLEPAITTAARGTYPAGGQKCCKDYDGGTYDGGTLHGVILNYYGSTCEKFISSGCCAGELGSIKNSALSAIGLLNPVSCEINHKGRYCQEVKQQDLSIDVDGTVFAGPGLISPAHKHLGESMSVVVHNNGCFGETAVSRIKQDLGGVLAGAGYNGADKIVHYTGPKSYVVDRPMTYATSRCVGGLTAYPSDEFGFSADGKEVRLWVRLSGEGLYRFVPDGPIFSALASNKYAFTIAQADVCQGLHVHGQHPCNGAPEPPGAGACGHGRVEPYMWP